MANFINSALSGFILPNGWVNPRRTATPFAGYRKRAVSASALGAIQIGFQKGSQQLGAFCMLERF